MAPETLDHDLESLLQDRIGPWLDDCLNHRGSHENCIPGIVKDNEDFSLPTRLVDVGDGDTKPVRLAVTQDEFPQDVKPKYLALSYCWGQSNEPAKTTRANLSRRQRKIDSENLPKTIQDGIKLTRLMGIRYLWVDAICIIQPHTTDKYLDDWNREASKMASYYSNAHCLISALGARDSGDGIFTERLAQRYQLTNCLMAYDNDRDEYLYLPFLQINFYSEFWKQPLLSRGWCFQERVLAPRALHWSANCLLWQCHSISEASEFDPGESIMRPVPILPRDEHHIFQKPAEDAMGASWTRLAQVYHSLQFTYQTDRLIAIQSLANRLATVHGDEYFAGVFRSQLADGLLWQPGTVSQYNKVLPYFPTWSWASHISKQPVSFRPWTDSLIRYTKEDVFPPAGNSTDLGDPVNRTLCIEAPLLLIKFDKHTLLRRPSYYEIVFQDPARGRNVEVQFDTLELVPDPLEHLYILLLSQYRSWSKQPDGGLLGLILRPKGQFCERIGYATLSSLDTSTSMQNFVQWKLDLDKERKEVTLI